MIFSLRHKKSNYFTSRSEGRSLYTCINVCRLLFTYINYTRGRPSEGTSVQRTELEEWVDRGSREGGRTFCHCFLRGRQVYHFLRYIVPPVLDDKVDTRVYWSTLSLGKNRTYSTLCLFICFCLRTQQT